MVRIGGFWPEIQFVVDVMTIEGFQQVVCSLSDVPFAGDWDKETNDISVGSLYSDRELRLYLAQAQDWDSTACVVLDLDEQRQLIDERLNIQLKEAPWNWVL